MMAEQYHAMEESRCLELTMTAVLLFWIWLCRCWFCFLLFIECDECRLSLLLFAALSVSVGFSPRVSLWSICASKFLNYTALYVNDFRKREGENGSFPSDAPPKRLRKSFIQTQNRSRVSLEVSIS